MESGKVSITNKYPSKIIEEVKNKEKLYKEEFGFIRFRSCFIIKFIRTNKKIVIALIPLIILILIFIYVKKEPSQHGNCYFCKDFLNYIVESNLSYLIIAQLINVGAIIKILFTKHSNG